MTRSSPTFSESGVRLAACAVLAGGIVYSSWAHAGMVVPCDRPEVFGGAAVNVIVLPYAAAEGASGVLSDAARTVALLVKLDVLSSARYGSLGVIRLEDEGSPAACEPQRVLERLKAGQLQGSFGEPREGSGLIVLWGRFFETEGSVYVQSYLSFFRHGGDEVIRLDLDDAPGERVELELPSQQVTFAPRAVSRFALQALVAGFQAASILRQAPHTSAPPVEFDYTHPDQFAFGVGEAYGDWVQILSFGSQPGGYVRLGAETRWALRDVLPELHLLDAVIGYLTLRARDEWSGSPLLTIDELMGLIEGSLERYRDAIDPSREPLPAGLSHALLAASYLVAAQQEAIDVKSAVAAAQPSLEAMIALLPNNPQALKLRAFTRLWGRIGPGELRASEVELTRALIAAPTDPTTIDGLGVLYSTMESQPDSSPYSAGELQLRVEALGKLRSAMTP